MALALYDRVQETTTTAGTGTVTLNGAVAGFQSFAVIGNGNTCYYTIVDGSAWEVGIGTYSNTGPTLARTTILSNSNANTSPINLSGGTANVFVTYPAEKSVNLDAAGNVSPLGTVSSGTWQGTTVGVAYGGTGVTSSSGANSVVLRDSNQNISVNRITQKRAITTASAGTTALTDASAFVQTLVGTGTHTFTLPDATLLAVGTWFLFDNDSTGNLIIQDYATGAVDTVAPGGYVLIILENNSTVAGYWIKAGLIPGEVNWGTNSLDLGGTTVVTNGTWQGNPVGVVYGGTGLNSISSANYALYSSGINTLTAGTLPTAAGGTGLTTFTGANNAIYSTSSSDLTAGTLPIAAGGTGATTLAGANIAVTNVVNTFTDDQVISVNDANAALRITQTGTGNALVVEDSANPDATPFVIDSNGSVVAGHTTPIAFAGFTPNVQSQMASQNSGFGAGNWQDTVGSPNIWLAKSRGAVGVHTIVQSGDGLGNTRFYGSDGTAFIESARISTFVDGAPATGSMPGRLVFSTTPSGSSTPTERMRIDSAGNVGIGGTPAAARTLAVQKNLTGSVTGIQVNATPAIQSDVTSQARIFNTGPSTQAATFTLGNLWHYSATQGTIGANSSVTTQVGYYADTTLTGATNNYGFFSNIASGTGRWNFYANGTADNYFAGNVGIATTSPGSALDVKGTIRLSGSSSGYVGLAPAAAAGSTTYTLPAADGTNGQVLSTNGSGTLSWTTASGGSASYTRTSFTATGGQTTFSVAYTVGYIEVFLNGVLLNGADYTATNGTTVVLATGATAGDIVETIAYSTNPTTITTANNIAGGTASQIVYQTSGSTTGFIDNGTAGQLLTSNGTAAPSWSFGSLNIIMDQNFGGF